MIYFSEHLKQTGKNVCDICGLSEESWCKTKAFSKHTSSGALSCYFLAHIAPFCGYICLGEKWARTFPWASTCRQELDLLPRMPHRGTLSPALSRQNQWNIEGRGVGRVRWGGGVTLILD